MYWAIVYGIGGKEFWLLAPAADDDAAQNIAAAALAKHERHLYRAVRWQRTTRLHQDEFRRMRDRYAVQLEQDMYIERSWSGWLA